MVDYDDVLEEIEREEKVDSATAYLEKTKRIKKEVSRLKKLFKDIDENKKKLVFSTIEDVGVIALLDERFLQPSYVRMFPREWAGFQIVNLNTIGKKIEYFWNAWI